jgi:hypothetical protein
LPIPPIKEYIPRSIIFVVNNKAGDIEPTKWMILNEAVYDEGGWREQ